VGADAGQVISSRYGSRRVLIVIVAVALVAVIAGVAIANTPALKERLFPPGPSAIHDDASLPVRLSVCGRTYVRSARSESLAEISADIGGASPVLADTGLFEPCRSGECTTTTATTPCYPIIYVRVGADTYRTYELSGGP
jgi:hypothetical protein